MDRGAITLTSSNLRGQWEETSLVGAITSFPESVITCDVRGSIH